MAAFSVTDPREPNDPTLRSWIPVEPESHFPIQNLPFGNFCRRGRTRAGVRFGTAVGTYILDLGVLADAGLFDGLPFAASFAARPGLEFFFERGLDALRAYRARISELLRAGNPLLRDDAELRADALSPQADADMLLPCRIGDYTDFYSSKEHATNVGTMLRGKDNALQPNWLHLPVAYHGRAGSIVASGAPVRRPMGQTKADSAAAPSFGPTKALDYELEMGVLIGRESDLGEPIPVAAAADCVLGMVLVNDWSARDIQKWEYVPLGPFLAKNFATSISPWVVTLDALAPFATGGPPQDPAPLPHLASPGNPTFDVELEVTLKAADLAEPVVLCRTNYKHLYWNFRQQLAHHTSNGCNVRPGDLLASGTISGPTKEARGCLLERTWGGAEPIVLPTGEPLRFLRDGDEISMTGWCQGDGYRVGFGVVSGRILPALDG
jgi:fumarylacetoacetase